MGEICCIDKVFFKKKAAENVDVHFFTIKVFSIVKVIIWLASQLQRNQLFEQWYIIYKKQFDILKQRIFNLVQLIRKRLILQGCISQKETTGK